MARKLSQPTCHCSSLARLRSPRDAPGKRLRHWPVVVHELATFAWDVGDEGRARGWPRGEY